MTLESLLLRAGRGPPDFALFWAPVGALVDDAAAPMDAERCAAIAKEDKREACGRNARLRYARTKAKWQRMQTIRFLSTKRDRNTDCTIRSGGSETKPKTNRKRPQTQKTTETQEPCPGLMAFCISTPTVPVVRSVPASSYVGRAFYQGMLPPLRSHACGAKLKPEQSRYFFLSLSLTVSVSLSLSE